MWETKYFVPSPVVPHDLCREGLHFHGQRPSARSVVCEKCQTGYRYELTRQGRGSASSPYFLFGGAAQDRAADRAQGNLAKRLDREAELVPCPKCYWINEDLVRCYRRRLYRWMLYLILAFTLVGFFVPAVISSVAPQAPVARTVARVLMIVGLSSAAWVLGIRYVLQQQFNPNRAHPRRPMVPPRTPPALVEMRDPRTGRSVVKAFSNQSDPAETGASRAVFRLGQFKFPEVCCVCLEPATTEHSSPFKVNHESDFPAPLCDRCDRRLKIRWWLLAFGIVAACVGASIALSQLIPEMDPISRGLVGGFGGLIVGGVAVAIVPNLICRPYRFGSVDSDRGVFWFRANHPTYTQMLIDLARASDNRPRAAIPRGYANAAPRRNRSG